MNPRVLCLLMLEFVLEEAMIFAFLEESEDRDENIQ